MQIVIEIDECLYTRLFDNGVEYASDMRRACVAIRKGIPLPQGHGRLIDAEILDLENLYRENDDYSFSMVYTKSEFPTIIEADMEV